MPISYKRKLASYFCTCSLL